VKVIEVTDLSFNYPDKAGVLDSMSFNITRGQKCGIIGPNGAGKTTLFHLMCGLLEPSSGSIYIKDKPVVHNTFNSSIGYVFQNTDDMLFTATVYEDISFGPLNLGLSPEEVQDAVDRTMRITRTRHLKDRPPHHLSGGEKRMVAIASVIAMRPEIIIYDEPTSELDMRARRNLIEFIHNSEETLLVASHDLEFILETCQMVLLINNGTIIASGAPGEIMKDVDMMLENGLERPHSLLHGISHDH